MIRDLWRVDSCYEGLAGIYGTNGKHNKGATMKLILSIIIVLLFVTVTAIIVTAKTEPVLTVQGSTLPISEPTGKTYNPQQTINGKTLQGSEL